MNMSKINGIAEGRAGVMAFALESLGNALFGAIAGPVQRERARMRLEAELSVLSDRELQDIGLTRSEIPRTLWGPHAVLADILRRQ